MLLCHDWCHCVVPEQPDARATCVANGGGVCGERPGNPEEEGPGDPEERPGNPTEGPGDPEEGPGDPEEGPGHTNQTDPGQQ